jgi:hypothetical protein
VALHPADYRAGADGMRCATTRTIGFQLMRAEAVPADEGEGALARTGLSGTGASRFVLGRGAVAHATATLALSLREAGGFLRVCLLLGAAEAPLPPLDVLRMLVCLLRRPRNLQCVTISGAGVGGWAAPDG